MRIFRSVAMVVLGGGVTLLLLIACFSVGGFTSQAIDVTPLELVYAIRAWWLHGFGSLSPMQKIVIYRLVRVVAAMLAGGLLAVSGVLYQTVLVNPLVDPYILGVSSGVALGTVLAYRYALPGPVFLWGLVIGLLAFGMTYILGGLGRDRLRLVLSGVVVSSVISSVVTMVMLMWNESLHNILAKLMGSFAFASFESLFWMGGVALMLVLFILGFSGHLDVLLLGDAHAHSVGVSPWVKRGALFLASLAAAVVAGFFGIISFVGLMAPHIARRFVGSSHVPLLLLSLFLGADIMLLADLLARGLFYPMEIPVGVFTSIAGGGFFLYLIFRGTGWWS